MYFRLSPEFIQKLKEIRQDYCKAAQTDLSEPSNQSTLHYYLGVKNTKIRSQQILFLEKWLTVLDTSFLIPGTVAKTSSENYIAALALMIAACCYVKAQISSTYKILPKKRCVKESVLFNLIDAALGISSKNLLDEETKNLVFLTANDYLDEKDCLKTLNKVLKHKEIVGNNALIQPFSKDEWMGFANFLSEKIVHIRAPSFFKNYPCTQFIKPLFSKSFKVVGCTVGQMLSNGGGEPLKKLEKHIALKTVVGGAIVLVTKVTPTKVALMLLTPLASELLIRNLVPWIFQTAGMILGEGIGFGVGMTLDLSRKLTIQLSQVIQSALSNLHKGSRKESTQQEEVNGFCLMTREFFIHGQSFSLEKVAALLETMPTITVDLENNDLFFNNINENGIEDLKDVQIYLQHFSEKISAPSVAYDANNHQ